MKSNTLMRIRGLLSWLALPIKNEEDGSRKYLPERRSIPLVLEEWPVIISWQEAHNILRGATQVASLLMRIYTQNNSRRLLGKQLSSAGAYLFVREERRS